MDMLNENQLTDAVVVDELMEDSDIDDSDEAAIDEYNEAVAEGYFPTEVQLNEWKVKYPEANFRGLNFPGMYVIYKSLNLAEYKKIQTDRAAKEKERGSPLTDEEVEHLILETCVFWPLDFTEKLQSNKIFAAIPTITSQYVMVASGFVDVSPEIL